MKKIITSCVLCILMLAGTVKAGNYTITNANPSAAPSYSVWIKIIITFHRPKLDCQHGFGICFAIEFGTDKVAASGSDFCPAQARINASGQLELMVAEEDLLKYENGSSLPYFRKGSITIEDAYKFSDSVTKKLGSDRSITVNPGTYRVAYDAAAHTFNVTFPI